MGLQSLHRVLVTLPLLAIAWACGSDLTAYTNNGGSPAMAGRVRHIKGTISTTDQMKTQNVLSASLLSEKWIPVDSGGEPIEGASLVFLPLPNRYRFYLELPDPDFPSESLFVMGETNRTHDPSDPTMRGQVLSPPECSAGRIFIGALQTGEQGPFLPVRFVGECRPFPYDLAGPIEEFLKFQSGTVLKSRTN
jgi:hypothetical protein